MPIWGCRYERLDRHAPTLSREELKIQRAMRPPSGSMAIPAENQETAEKLFAEMLLSKGRLDGGEFESLGCVER